MKKISFLAALFAVSLLSFGQSLDEINDMMGKFQYKKAKDGIDKYLNDTKNAANSDGWYYKGRIYNSLSRDSSISMQDALKYKMESFNAFKKLQEMEKKDIRLKLESYLSYFDLYNGFFDLGAKSYNVKDYDGAYNGFKNALLVEDYTRERGYEATNGFKFPPLDTSLVFNTAISAKIGKNEEGAVIYYKKLAESNLSAENFLEVYLFLSDYYYRKNDMTSFAAITEKGKRFYPKEPYWDESYYESVAIENATKGLVKEELVKKYEELIAKYPNNFLAAYNYSIDLYKYIYSEDIKAADAAAYKSKFENAIKKAISLKSTAEDNFLMANYLYNSSFDLTDQAKNIKGTKPEDTKKKAELNNASKKSLDDCIPYAQNAIDLFEKLPKMKGTEKANYKQSLDMLSEIYRVKGEPKRSADYKAKKDAVDKM